MPVPTEGKPTHPGVNELAAYLAGTLSRDEKDAIDEHLALCDTCLATLCAAHEAVIACGGGKGHKEKRGRPGDGRSAIHSSGEEHDARRRPEGGPGTGPAFDAWKRISPGGPYPLLAAGAFAASFLVPRYFIQLLVATLILGIKWIVDAKTTKMLVMIHEAWKREGAAGTVRVMERLDGKTAAERLFNGRRTPAE